MLTIYAIPASLYCAKLRILLRYKQLEWREIPPPGGYGSDEYKALVPAGNLPALRDGDLLLADSEVIAEYLEERHPDPPALPGDAVSRARARARSRFHDTRLEPALRASFRYLPGREPITAAASEALSLSICARMTQLALLLADMPQAGESLTLGECGFPITFSWLDELTPRLGLAIDWPERVLEYRERVETLDPVHREVKVYRETLTAYFAA